MKPNPLSSLNHFTVPVGICCAPPRVCACYSAEDAAQSFDLRALALLSPVLIDRPDAHDGSTSPRGDVVQMLQADGLPTTTRRSGGAATAGGGRACAAARLATWRVPATPAR